MTTDFHGFELDDSPICPRCKKEEIGIYHNGYYCLNCSYPFDAFQGYSKGVPGTSLPETVARAYHILNNGHDYDFECEGEATTDWYVPPSTVTYMETFLEKRKSKVKKWQEFSHLPSDYEECKDCGYDHSHDSGPAKRWHDAHPEFGQMITQDDLVSET